MSSTGAECVRAPTAMRSAPAAAQRGHVVERDPTGHLDRDATADQLDRGCHLGGVHVVEQDQVGAGGDAPP